MASEMQFVPTMTSAKATILSVILAMGVVLGSFAKAEEESDCVKSFRKANNEYFKSNAALQQRQQQATIGAVGGGLAGVSCMAVRRTVVGVIGCGAVGTLIGGGSYAYSSILSAKLQRLFDAHRLYQAYLSTTDETLAPSEYTTQFVRDLGVDVSKEQDALKDMAGLMKWGALCEGEQPRSYDEVLDLMKTRLHAPQ